MPSVGMRRSTRVFGARVLRSGRRLWTSPHEFVRGAHGENKFSNLLESSTDGGGDTDDFHKEIEERESNENGNSASVDITSQPEIEERESNAAMEVEQDVDIMYGIVYRRKRKRAELTGSGLTEKERHGKKFARKQRRAKCRPSESFGNFRVFVRRPRDINIVVNRSSYDCGYWIACFLTSVLSYMARVEIGIWRLCAFMRSKPIYDAFASRGMLFLQAPITAKTHGACVISGPKSSMPLFSVYISALPSLFVHMQTIISLQSARLDCLFTAHYSKDERVTDGAGDTEEHSLQISSWKDNRESVSEASHVSPERNKSYNDVAAPKSTLRNLQLRNTRNIQKRRSSLRRKRGRPPSAVRSQRSNGALASDFFRVSPTHFLRNSDNRKSKRNVEELNSAEANLLVTERDRCYRVEGVTVSLELSASKQWLLIVVKNGTKRLTFSAQKVMRPPCSNRFTHAVVWAGDGGWKLEFVNKLDWLIFKELYKECSERNVQSVSASVIPVPGVVEVSGPFEARDGPYVRPDLYITVKDDELVRALGRKSGNYDMDSEDEEWLAKLNSEMREGGEREMQERVTPESFELLIDALEKGSHCNPDEHLDEPVAYDFCVDLERREVVEAIHKYWVSKRKQKRSALIRVFQLYQPRRSQVIPKSVLRKKRSFKRQASQAGRGKQRPLLQALAAERDALEQKNTVNKLQEAKAAAERYEGLAMVKRQRAQMLMENADLATYKAIMALRIAEAAQTADSPETTVSSFFLERPPE